MIPYKEAAEELKRQQQEPGKFLKSLAGNVATGAGFAGGASLFSKMVPFLNKYVPVDLASRALSKISPQLGKFIKESAENGHDPEEVRDFLGERVEEHRAQQKRNIIEQYSPELYSFMDTEIKKGRSPIEAGAIAQHDKRFSQTIKKISKDHKADWSAIIQSVFGQGAAKATTKEEALKQFINRKKPGLRDELVQQFQDQYGQMEQQGQQASEADQRLMAMLEKVNQALQQ